MQITTSGFLWAVIFSSAIPLGAQAVSINERAGNNFRTAANNQEFTLNKNNVNTGQFGLLHVHDFNAKVETQPLVVENGAGGDDLVIITTMRNEVIGVNARTNARVYEKKLGTEINSSGTEDMDVWGHTPTWGISATPIIDTATDTLFVAAWVLKNANDNDRRDYKVFALDPKTGQQKASPVRIFGQSQEGNGCWFNDSNVLFKDSKGRNEKIYPKLRAGLALTGNHGLVLAFAANGEAFKGGRKNPHGFVIAYDTRGLLEQAGVSRKPAMFCNTAFKSWGGGIWQAGGAPVTENDMIYVATSNGTSNNSNTDLTESMIKLRFIPGGGGSRPVLSKVDFYKAFLDEHQANTAKCLWQDNTSEVSCGRANAGKAGADWDFGSSGPLLFPGSHLLLQGTKDGIIYSLDKNNLGKHDRFNQLMSKPPLVASYFGGDVNQNWDRANRLNRSIPCVPSDSWFMPCGDPENNKTHHIHALALAQRDPSGGIVFVWGENAGLKAYNFSTTHDVFPTFRAEGDELASQGEPSPGGMPGGLLMVSGKPSTLPGSSHGVDSGTAILWAVYPMRGDSNKHFAEAQLVAYDATTILPGNKLKRLYRTGDDNHGGLGTMTRMAPPVVANGRVYVLIYRFDHGNLAGSQLKVFGL